MSVTVRHLNADSSFHLIFSPEPQPSQSDLRASNGAYSILIDPWLVGSSVTTAPWFAVTDRLVPSSIQHLSELEDVPDVVLCSQNKSDHTNKETLLQLKPDGKTIFVAEPGAAKSIRSWKYFDPLRVHAMRRYEARAAFGNCLRFHIPPLSPQGDPGEVNIAFIPAKNYVTGLHNAFGITYQAPTRTKAVATVSTVDLPKPRYFHLPLAAASMPSVPIVSPVPSSSTFSTPEKKPKYISIHRGSAPESQGHRPQLSESIMTTSSEVLPLPERPVLRLFDDLGQADEISADKPIFSDAIDSSSLASFSFNLPTPPSSPKMETLSAYSSMSAGSSQKTSMSSWPSTTTTPRPVSALLKPTTIHPARPKALSVLYIPHGVGLVDLQPYIQTHLVRLRGALPLTLLLHCFNYTQNPWYLGGNIMTGAAGGMDIAKALMARCWISAHDELKDDRGLAVKLTKLQPTSAEEIRRALLIGEENRRTGWICDVRNLGVGKEMTLSAEARDLCGSGIIHATNFLNPNPIPNQLAVEGD